MTTSIASAWTTLLASTSYTQARRLAASVGVKPSAAEAALRLHRERAEAKTERVDALARRRPGGAVVRWTGRCLIAAVRDAGYRTTTHGHDTKWSISDAASVSGVVYACRPSDLGLSNAYARKAFSVSASTHHYTVTPSWLRNVKVRGAAVVGGLVTVDMEAQESEPGIYEAVWAEQGRGAALRQRSGFLVRVGDGWQHADTLAGARRLARRTAVPTKVARPLPTDASALLRRARLSGDELVTRAVARLAGHCDAGIRDWVSRHDLSERTEITARELATIACSSGDRIADVYAVLLAARREARRAA